MRIVWSPALGGGAAVVVAFGLDQATKALALAHAAALRSGVSVFPGFDLTLLRNDGVTFGLLRGAPWWGLVALALVICVVLGSLLLRAQRSAEAIAYGAVIGGALGNVLDRIRFGGVTDFIDLYAGAWRWPAFNLADVAIVCGAAVLVLWPRRRPDDRS
jgi:signal peptidase II